MCGIIITKDKGKLDLIKHRGIESNFIKIENFYYCHHRLPIQTEVGDKWIQPLELKNGGLLLFNGEIFNFDKTKYNSDVEYLLDLFSSENFPFEEILKWDGFWSIVVIRGNDIYCFTDPLGKKQLYYNKDGGICSEIFPIANKGEVDLMFKSSVFKWGYNVNDSTPFKNVKRILPNKFYHFYKHKLGSISKEYFNWFNSNHKIEDLEELINISISNRLISKKYEIGCLVSGGLDSSIIAYFLKQNNSKVNFYSIENDEKYFVDLLSKDLDIDIKYLNYELNQDIEESFRYNETPIDLGSVLPQHKLFSIIPEKVILSGDGADELFGGYKRINDYDSQYSDIFEELTYYHLPRLDRASMRYTIELRNPFLSHDIIKLALKIPYKERINKKILKDIFKCKLNDEILNRVKVPLKNNELKNNQIEYRKKVFDIYYNKILNHD